MEDCELEAPRLCIACDRMAAPLDFACPGCGTRKARQPGAFWTEVAKRSLPAWTAQFPAWRRSLDARLHPVIRERVIRELVEYEVTPRENRLMGRYRPNIVAEAHEIWLWSRLTESEARETFAHELAHLVAFVAFREGAGHGGTWSRIQWRFGYTPTPGGQIYGFSWNRWHRRHADPREGRAEFREHDGTIQEFRLERSSSAVLLNGTELERACDWYAALPDGRRLEAFPALDALTRLSAQVRSSRILPSLARVHVPRALAREASSWHAFLPKHCHEEADAAAFARLPA